MTGPERALAFFEEARAGFARASQRCRVRREDYRFGRRPARIVSTDGFAYVHRAMAHARTPAAGQPELEIWAWDARTDGFAMPSPPWQPEDYGVRGEIRGFNDARFRTAFDHLGNSLSMFDAERGLAIFWTRDTDALPQSERGAPCKTIFHWWMEQSGGLLVHAGAVGNTDGAVLLVGPGGAGKSTTALCAVRAGLGYLGDDYCTIAVEKPPRVFCLYGTGKVTRVGVPRFSAFAATGDGGASGEEEKALFYPGEAGATATVGELPLRAIFIPHITASGTRTSIVPAAAGEAFKALAPSTIPQLSGAGATMFQRLARLVRAVPSYRISLARDYDTIGEKIRAFLETEPA